MYVRIFRHTGYEILEGRSPGPAWDSSSASGWRGWAICSAPRGRKRRKNETHDESDGNHARRSLSAMLLAALLLAGCSTTRRLAPGEVLYTGVHRIPYRSPTRGCASIGGRGGGPLSRFRWRRTIRSMHPRLRTPLPIGLWAYNYLYTPEGSADSNTGSTAGWPKEPVLISKVQPSLRSQVAVQALENYGYFGSRATDSLLYRKRGRKARVDYTLRVAPPWHYAGISYPTIDGALAPLFDSLHATSLLREGAQYNLDTLTLEQRRITDVLRNRGLLLLPARLSGVSGRYDPRTPEGGPAARASARNSAPGPSPVPYRAHCRASDRFGGRDRRIPSGWARPGSMRRFR